MSQVVQPDAEQDSGIDAILTNLPVMLWQRRWIIIIPLVICLIGSIAAAFLLPHKYRSTATLLVESQELPTDVTAPSSSSTTTNVIDQRIAKIRQQILSRPDLIELIQNNSLYAADRATKPLSKVIDDMRDSVDISPVNADINRNGGTSSTTIAFTLSFAYPEADKAQIVAQDFVDRLMKLDASQTEKQATNTVAFLQDQATSLQGQISEIERQITTIKAQNGAALAAGGALVMGGGGYEAQIASIQRDNASLAAQAANDASSGGKDPAVVAAESNLTALKAVYSDNHPDVRIAQQRLAEAKANAAKNKTHTTSPYRDQIATNNALIQSLNAQRGSDSARAAAASRAPAITEQVSQLESKADGLRLNFQRVQTNLLNAQATAKMESEQRGERLTIVDPPVVPDHPSSPNRPVVIAGGILGGGLLGIVLAFLVEMILGPIRGTAALTRLVGTPPLVVIPVMTREDTQSRWQKLAFWRRWRSQRA